MPGQARSGRGYHCRRGDFGVRPGVGPDVECGVAQGEPVRLAVDPFVGAGPEQRQDGFERLLHHRPLPHRVDAHHVGVGRQRSRAGAEHHPPAREVVEQHPPVGHHQRMVVGQRHHAGAQPDVPGALGGRRDEHLRAGDQLVSAGVVLPEPGLVEPEAVQRLDPIHVVLQCVGWGLADRMERRDEHPEVQWAVGPLAVRRAHFAPDSARNSSRAALTSAGRSC